MLKNYFVTAFRNLVRNKVFSLINIFGLAVGIACCLLSAVYLHHEFTFDNFHSSSENVYRVVLDNYRREGAHATTPLPVGPAIQEEFSDVRSMTRFMKMQDFLVRYQENSFFENVAIVDSGFFDVFSFELLKGNPHTALNGPNQIVLTAEMATKYFGDEDPIGKLLSVGSSGRLNSIITGIVKDPPTNSQLQFDFLLSISTLVRTGTPMQLWFQMPENYTYIRTNEWVVADQLSDQFEGFAKKYLGEQLNGPYETTYKVSLQELRDIHLIEGYNGEFPTRGNITAIFLLSSISLVIILIASINYVNLTTAHHLRRAREVAVRKVAGASRLQVISQLLSESVVLATLSGVAALLLAEAMLPRFNEIVSTDLQFHVADNWVWLGSLWIFLILLPAFGAGFFPAVFLARTNIIRSLKSNLTLGVSRLTLRRTLVVFQLTVAVFLLSMTLVVLEQLDFIKDKLYTHSREEQVLVFPINTRIARSFSSVQNQLEGQASITSVAASSLVPGFSHDTWPVRTSLDSDPLNVENFVVDNRFMDVMGYSLLAGRNFDSRILTDSSAFIINEKAVIEFGFQTPEQALGKKVFWGLENPKEGEIIGVVKDFNFSSFREEIRPAMFQLNTAGWLQYASVRLNTANLSASIDHIKQAISSADNNWVVDYKFMDDNFQKLHQRDLVQGKALGSFAAIAVVICCLGLLGLIIFSASQRVKELGIRKTLGASAFSLAVLFTSDFAKLFGIAFVIAVPISLYATQQWLSEFAYRIKPSAGVYLTTAIILLAAIILTIAQQVFKVSQTNPAEVLKGE